MTTYQVIQDFEGTKKVCLTTTRKRSADARLNEIYRIVKKWEQVATPGITTHVERKEDGRVIYDSSDVSQTWHQEFYIVTI